MRSVKTPTQLAALRGETPAAAPLPDHTEALSKHLETTLAAMQRSTDQHEAALLHSLQALAAIAKEMGKPVDVTLNEQERCKCWKFTCKYDLDDKLINIIAEAKE